MEFKRYNKYYVLKIEDIDTYLSQREKETLALYAERIGYYRQQGGKKLNSYVVVNEDQPYADYVWAIIENQWHHDND